ncbi:MAG: SOS response-associated peptidase [Pseudomonadales bacterium]|nr:SOS response-associated peptidase [Pseudomonadales bacterium]
MCGRFNVISDPLNRLIVEITGRGFELEDQFNIAPTEQIPVLIRDDEGDWDVRNMRWWLVPNWAKEPDQKYAMYNARSENLGRSRAFREPFRERRCIIPASGYYEWTREGKAKVPWYIEPAEQDGFAFAGLWDRWRGDDRVIESCTIVTTAAPDSIRNIHDRMPVQLTMDEVARWVHSTADADDLTPLLVSSLRMPLRLTPVSTWVNNARNKDVRAIEPVGESTIVS